MGKLSITLLVLGQLRHCERSLIDMVEVDFTHQVRTGTEVNLDLLTIAILPES